MAVNGIRTGAGFVPANGLWPACAWRLRAVRAALWCRLLPVAFVATAIAQPGVAPGTPMGEPATRTASVAGPGCAATLDYRERQRTLVFRDACRDSPDASAMRFERLLVALFGTAALPRELRALDAGRLIELPPPFALRLALAASESASWGERLRQRPAPGAGNEGWANGWVATTILEQGLLREIEQPLRRRGVAPDVIGVEKVLVGVPAQTPLREALAARRLPLDRELPFDAMLWFALRHPAPAAPE